jgi:predicted PurR-regulated permease PerM
MDDSPLKGPAAESGAGPRPPLNNSVLTNSVLIIAVLSCFAAAHWLQELLSPLIVAVFSLFLIDVLADQVGRWAPRTPEWVRVGAAFAFIIILLGASGALIYRAAPRFSLSLAEAAHRGQDLVYDLSDRFGLPFSDRPLSETVDFKSLGFGLLSVIRRFATGLLLVIVYLGFILASRRTFTSKLDRLFKTPEARSHAERVFERVRLGAESYVGLQAFKGALLALIFWVVMRLAGLDNALFLAFLAFIASFIPIIGPAAAVILPVVLCAAQYDLGWRPLAMGVALEASVIAIDSVLLPRLQGERLDVDPVIVLVSLGFWNAIFGITGALFSTLLTVVVIAIVSEVPRLQWLAIVLSKRGERILH